MLSGSLFRRRGAYAQNALSPNLFRLVCVIFNKFLVFDLSQSPYVLACLTNSSLKYRGIQLIELPKSIPLSGFEYRPWHVRKLPVTWG